MSTGRPTDCTPALTAKVVQALLWGNYIEAACGYVGIAVATYHNWCNRGRTETARRAAKGYRAGPLSAKEQPFVDFVEAVENARASAELESVQQIRQAAHEQWQAAAWWLERSFPARWGRRVHDLRGPDDGPVVVATRPDLSSLSLEERRTLADILRRADAGGSGNVPSDG